MSGPFNKKIILMLMALLTIAGISGLILLKKHQGHDHAAAHQKKTIYHCPMHPSIITDEPGQCPICHMNLEKVEDESENKPAKEETHQHAEASVDGRSSFSLSNERQQLIGVATTKVEMKDLHYKIRASGRVAFDPDLYTAIEEYRQSLLAVSSMRGNNFSDLKEQSRELLKSSETKLKLMGLSDAQIRKVGKTNSDPMNLLLPRGMVWVYAEVFEYEVGGLKEGQEFEVHAPSIPGKTFKGKVSSINSIVNSPSRTVRVRAEVPDPEHLFRPDTFVNAEIRVDLGMRLSVPEDAVLHSGDRDFVFVVKDEGRFEPRPVKVGVRTSGYYEILSGLEEGESVVTGANFLIDSESRLRSALQNFSAPAAEGHGQHK